jgi:6-phosphogluconolactonase (cycloisomerase 2 family)
MRRSHGRHTGSVAAGYVLCSARLLLWLALCAGALAGPATASAEQLYVANSGSNLVSGFTIGIGGALSPIACSQEDCETGTEPVTVAVSPNGKFLFVANRGASTVETFAIGADGTLSEVGCAKHCTTAADPAGMATTPDGRFVYVANEGKNTIAAYSVATSGALTKVACATASSCETEAEPFGLAVSPSGQFLYATNVGANTVSVFSIGTGGVLSPVSCSSCQTESHPSGLAVSPNGQFLYVANRGSNTVSIFSLGTSGVPSPVSCLEEACKTEAEPDGVAVSANGEYLYTSDVGSHSISPFSIGANGALSPLKCAALSCETGSEPVGVAVSPDSQLLYTANVGSNTISPFSIGTGGMLSPLACTPPSCAAGTGLFFQSLAITPDQAPTASFTDTPAPAGSASSFNASASAASPEQDIASYDWSFGDGTSTQSTSPTVSHVFATTGTYTVSLTVTDTVGCSTQVIFTGQTASCNGSSAAQTSATVTVAGSSLVALKLKQFGNLFPNFPKVVAAQPILTLSALRETARIWREGTPPHISASDKRLPLGTRFSFYLSEAANVALTFTEELSGRQQARKCVAPTKHNERKRHCTRMIAAGTLTLSAAKGANGVRFDGVISKYRKLLPGKYTLLARATAATQRSTATATALHFTIVK